jgi:hypothetical protein
MSTPILVIGGSGTGKSTSFRNLDPSKTLLIQAIAKPLPFSGVDYPGWARFNAETKTGNIFVTDDAASVIALINGTKRKTIIIDDVQYIMANEYMRRCAETGYAKFTEIARHMWDILNAAAVCAPDVHIYMLSHSEITDAGQTKIKTIGKLLDDKITVEGMFSMVLKTVVQDGKYYFATKNNGQDTTKTPMGMFKDELIPNDLAEVDAAVIKYGW